jgi:hypothetical protein
MCVDYDALIDVIGLFKDYSNIDIGKYIHETINRDVIFIDSMDNIYVIINSEITEYDEKYKYNKPFIYLFLFSINYVIMYQYYCL